MAKILSRDTLRDRSRVADRKIIAKYLTASLAFGIAMGLFFPVYAGFFAQFPSEASRIVFSLGCVGAGLIVGFASYLIGRSTILRVIREVADRLDELDKGEGDLTYEIGIVSSDVIGRLTQAFDRFLAKLRTMVRKLGEIAEGAQQVGFELAANSTQTSAASEQISRHMEMIQGRTEVLIAEVDTVNDAKASIDASATAVAESINLQSDSLTKLSALVERTVEELRAISSLTRSQADAIAVSIQSSSRNLEGFLRVVGKIREIDESVRGIGELAKSIGDIAERIGILGINASIEASHAGVAGRGFAVVAAEIGKLAESAGHDSSAINARLREVVGLVGSGVELSESTGRDLTSLLGGINGNATDIQAVADRFELSIRGAESMLVAHNELVKATMVVTDSMISMKDSTGVIGNSVDILLDTAGEYHIAVTEVAQGIHEIAADVAHLHRVSSINAENVESLKSEIGKFKA